MVDSLTVISDFGQYTRGKIITDPATMISVLTGPNQLCVDATTPGGVNQVYFDALAALAALQVSAPVGGSYSYFFFPFIAF